MLRRLFFFLVIAASCKGVPEISLGMSLPPDVKSAATWFEVGAFHDVPCDAIGPMLGNGVPDGSNARVAFRREDPRGPKMGELPAGRYAFAATARADDCGVLAVGCKDVTVPASERVTISLEATDPPTGKCATGAVCQAARCVPSADSRDPTVGAHCSLELLGSGPLVNTTGGQGTLMSAPAIAPIPNGFVIAYREIDPSASAGARIVLLSVDASGGAFKAEKPKLPNRCPNSDEIDGIGLIVKDNTGMVALARPACGAKPGLELLDIGPSPDVAGLWTPGKFYVSLSPNDARVSLGAAHASSFLPDGSAIIVFTEAGTAKIAKMDPTQGIVPPNGNFGATAGVTDAWVTANDKVLALLAAGRFSAAPVADGGADSGEIGPDPALGLLMLPPDTPIDSISAADDKPRAPIRFPGSWGSLAALGSRVVVLGEGIGPGSSVTYRVFDGTSDTPVDIGGYSVDGAGKVTAGDVAVDTKRAYFASLKTGAISLDVYDKFATKLEPLRSLSFASEPRIAAINTIRDGHVAVTLGDGRVAVAWTTAEELDGNDPAGGYAIFACTD